MSVQLKAGAYPVKASIDAQGAGLSVLLSEPRRSGAVWRLRVLAEIQDALVPVGELYTTPANATSGSQWRVVAMAGCPGVIRWHVEGSQFSGARNETARLALGSSECCAEFGLVRIEEQWRVASGVDGALALPASARVTRIYAFTTQVGGGTIAVPSGLAPVNVAVPEAGSVLLEPAGKLRGPGLAFTFTNTDGFSVEYLVS